MSSKTKQPKSQPPKAKAKTVSSKEVVTKAFTVQTAKPVIMQTPGGSMRVRHRELVASINGSVAFAATQYRLNPGLSSTFPWLSAIAAQYEQYTCHKLSFVSIPRVAYTATGVVQMAPDYDPLDAAPTTEVAAASYLGCMEGDVKEQLKLNLERSAMHPLGPRKFVRSALIGGSDLKTYDVGSLFYCTNGQADASAISKLWVEYDFEFHVPQTSSSTASTPATFAQFNLSSNQSLTTATEATLVFDETVVNSSGIVNSSGVFTLPSGNWLVMTDIGVGGGTGTAAISTLQVEIQKNNADLTIPCDTLIADQWSGAGVQQYGTSATAYVASTGTDTCRVRVTYTSGSGTLVATADRCRVSFLVL